MNRFASLVFLIICLSFKCFGQPQVLNLKWAEIYKNKVRVSEGSAEGEQIIIDQKLGRISYLINSTRMKDQIFKINDAQVAEKDKNVKVFTCELQVQGGVAPIIIYLNTFYKTVRILPYQGNEDGLSTYMDYQYK